MMVINICQEGSLWRLGSVIFVLYSWQNVSSIHYQNGRHYLPIYLNLDSGFSQDNYDKCEQYL